MFSQVELLDKRGGGALHLRDLISGFAKVPSSFFSRTLTRPLIQKSFGCRLSCRNHERKKKRKKSSEREWFDFVERQEGRAARAFQDRSRGRMEDGGWSERLTSIVDTRFKCLTLSLISMTFGFSTPAVASASLCRGVEEEEEASERQRGRGPEKEKRKEGKASDRLSRVLTYLLGDFPALGDREALIDVTGVDADPRTHIDLLAGLLVDRNQLPFRTRKLRRRHGGWQARPFLPSTTCAALRGRTTAPATELSAHAQLRKKVFARVGQRFPKGFQNFQSLSLFLLVLRQKQKKSGESRK